jgi:hypothetical protein
VESQTAVHRLDGFDGGKGFGIAPCTPTFDASVERRVEKWRGGWKKRSLWSPAHMVTSFRCRFASPVSTSRSSNRTGGFPASGSPTGFAMQHTKRHDTAPSLPSLDPSAGSESLVGGYRQHGHSPDLSRFQTAPEVRPLPSTGITRFLRYYEPVRHPTRPGLSLAGVRLPGGIRTR